MKINSRTKFILRQQPTADLLIGCCACFVTVCVAASVLANQLGFFLSDDYATYFMPIFGEIARLLNTGQSPFITDRIWQGGAILSEYQSAILNPICVSLYFLTSQIADLRISAAIYSLVHIAIFSGGTYFLCRSVQCDRGSSFLAAVVAPTCEWIFYWGAANWIPFLVSIAWLPFAWGALIQLANNRKWLLPASCFVALVLLSGCPFTNFALGISIVAACAVWLAGGRKNRHGAARVGLSISLGTALALPAILPLIAYLSYSGRPLEQAWAWQANIPSLLGVGIPYFVTQWRVFAEPYVRPVVAPMLCAAWFVPLALANARWSGLLRRPMVVLLVTLAVTYALLAMAPVVWQFRWMFRLIPYLHLCLVILTAIILSELRFARGEANWRIVPTAFALFVPLWIAAVQVKGLSLLYCAEGVVLFILAAIALLIQRLRLRGLTLLALAGHVAFFLSVNAAYTHIRYPAFPNMWAPPTVRDTAHDGAQLRHYAIFKPLKDADPGGLFWRTYLPGNLALEHGGISLNGYSPFAISSFKRSFCFAHLASTDCADVTSRITSPVAPTGSSLLDLARVDEITVDDSNVAGELHNSIGARWGVTALAAGGWRFTRTSPIPLPDPVSSMSVGVETRVAVNSAQRLVLSVRNSSLSHGYIVFARAWYPGWHAELNGRQLAVRALDGIFLSVDLPASAAGRLTLVYWPRGFWLGLLGAVLAAAVLAAFACWDLALGRGVRTVQFDNDTARNG